MLDSKVAALESDRNLALRIVTQASSLTGRAGFPACMIPPNQAEMPGLQDRHDACVTSTSP